MKYFIISIVTAISSLFGIHSQPLQQATSTIINTAQTDITQNTPLANTKSFTDSTGSYSFQYPSNLSVVETNGVVIISTNPKDSTQPHVSIAPGAFVKNLSSEESATTVKISSAMFGNVHAYTSQTGYQETNKAQWNQISRYIIPLDNDADPSQFIEVINYGTQTSVPSTTQVEAIVASLKFDKTKLLQITGKEHQFMSSQNIVAGVHQDLVLISELAAEYFDTQKTYAGLCSPQTTIHDAQRVNSTIQYMINSVGTSSVVCYANGSGYAVSVKQPNGTIACIDATGLTSSPSAMSTGPSCGAAQKQVNSSQTNPISDSTIRQYLTMARNDAENYYSVNSSSYAGFCTTDQEFQSIKTSLPNVSFSCHDSATSYAFSASLSGGGYACADYYGYNGTITAPNSQTYCVAQTTPVSTVNNVTSSTTVLPISSANVSITYPTGGSVLRMGQSYNITWVNPPSQTTNCSVYLENGAGVGVSSLYLGSVNSGQRTFAFKVPSNVTPGNQFKLYLMYASNGNVITSSPSFSIEAQ